MARGSKLTKSLCALALAGAGLAAIPTAKFVSRNIDIFDSEISIELKEGSIDIPVYNCLKVPSGNCSGYVRRAAKDLFGKEYSISDAWNRRYNDNLVSTLNDNDDLRKFYKNGILKPGMIIGTYFPDSSHLNDKDQTGNQVRYTHNLLFLGENPQDELIFIEKFGQKTQSRTLEEFSKNGLTAKEIIDAK